MRGELTESDLLDDPIELFRQWYADAESAGIAQPNAMTLATATPDGRPSARVVLLKDVNEDGFAFYTNFTSPKARELAENPYAALVFLWAPLMRQVRVTGPVARVGDAESDAYFATRPRGSQLGAWASVQSLPLADRTELDERWATFAARYDGGSVPRPPHWGGFRLAPEAIEFWQGRENRLHDRFRYTRAGAAWERTRLQP